MATRIGHASGSENKNSGWDGKAKAGDQTGSEVCIRSYYSKPWHTILRAKDNNVAQAMAKHCENGCNNPNIGYDQSQRNTAHDLAKKVNYDLSKIVTPCETDCSAFMTLCAICAGVKELEYTTNAPTTSTMVNAFNKTGKFQTITGSGIVNDPKYMKRGDVLVGNGHTAMVLDDGVNANTTPTPTIRPTIKEGDKGSDVTYLKQKLKKMGFGNLSMENDLFTKGVGDAVEYFRITSGLSDTRICDKDVWNLLG